MQTLLDFDTWLTLLLNGSDYSWLDHTALTLTKAYVWLPLYGLLLWLIVRQFGWRRGAIIVVGVALCVVVCDQVASSIVKPLVCRLRPTHEPRLAELVDVSCGYRGGRYGFFSSHAANTMSVAVYVSLVMHKRWLTLLLATWCLVNCWTRLYLGVHYASDILVGLAFGASIGWIAARCVVSILTPALPMEERK